MSYRKDQGARVGIAGAAIVVIALVVGGYLLVASMNHVLPDLNPSSRPSTGAGGGTTTATSYAVIKAHMTVTTAIGPLAFTKIVLTNGGWEISVHEVNAPAPGPATVFVAPKLTIGDDCHGRAIMGFTTPDYTGKATSNEIDLTLDQPGLLRWGNLNMYGPGSISLSFDVQVKGCNTGLYPDWTTIQSGLSAGTFAFDGVDNFKNF